MAFIVAKCLHNNTVPLKNARKASRRRWVPWKNVLLPHSPFPVIMSHVTLTFKELSKIKSQHFILSPIWRAGARSAAMRPMCRPDVKGLMSLHNCSAAFGAVPWPLDTGKFQGPSVFTPEGQEESPLLSFLAYWGFHFWFFGNWVGRRLKQASQYLWLTVCLDSESVVKSFLGIMLEEFPACSGFVCRHPHKKTNP